MNRPRSRTELDALFLTVTCPRCKAEPGQVCDYRGTHRWRVTHLARQDKAIRAENRRLYSTRP